MTLAWIDLAAQVICLIALGVTIWRLDKLVRRLRTELEDE